MYWVDEIPMSFVAAIFSFILLTFSLDMQDSEMIINEEQNDMQIRRRGKNWITYSTYVVNTGQEKLAGVLFCNKLWHWR